MLKPVYPVVRLPYDRPNRVARVLDTVRNEFRASQVRLLRLQTTTSTPTTAKNCPRPMTARESTDTITAANRTGSTCTVTMTTAAAATTSVYVDQNFVDQVTVGVRDCTLTPKTRPEILVSAGSNTYLDNKQQHILAPFATTDGGPYLLVPPVNITAEISRPPLTAAAPQLYTRT